MSHFEHSAQRNDLAGAGRIDEGLRAHMNRVYATMSVGTFVTFLTAWSIGTAPELLAIFHDPETMKMTLLGWVAMFSPLAMIFAMGVVSNRSSAAALQTFFYVFSAIMGISISSIFAVYDGLSIAQVFLVTSISFAGLSLWGYTTRKDISAWGSFLIMGVIGLIVAMIVNIFLGSETIMLAISALGVVIFAGLTAYDTQKIKTDYLSNAGMGEEARMKLATWGALTLYLDFLNMFMLLLSLMGNRD